MTVPENEFFQAFGRLEGKIDLLVKQMPDFEKRLRALENWRWMVLGGAAVVGTIGGLLVTLVMK